MRSLFPAVVTIVSALVALAAPAARGEDKPFPNFRMQEISHDMKIGYAVLLIDLNGDGKPDVVVADKERVVWFENPSWKLHTILQGRSAPDNVCLAAMDVDGDGKVDLVLGAGWKGYNTKDEGTVQWLGRGADVNEPWALHPIGKEVDIHRIHVADVEGIGKPQIIVAPLLGKGATQKANWTDAAPRLLELAVPKDAVNGPWEAKVITDQFLVNHNFTPVSWKDEAGTSLLLASYEGVNRLRRKADGSWEALPLCAGDQSHPQGSRGCSEVKTGHGAKGDLFIATVEPWHGNQAVVYTPPAAGEGMWTRQVIDDQMKEGHGVWCADLDGDGADEIIVGSRNPLNASTGPGVNIFKRAADGAWQKHVLDNQGVAAEDLAALDLDGDGRIDIVAVGRATHNVRIYWNEGAK